MKTILFFILLLSQTSFGAETKLSRNKPRQKVTDAQTVTIKESFSVALSGLQTESYRIQKVLFKGKNDVYMVTQLVNGEVFLEKPFKASGYDDLKNTVMPLTRIPTSDLCTNPVTIRSLQNGSENVSKVCGEKSEIMDTVMSYIAKAKTFIGDKK